MELLRSGGPVLVAIVLVSLYAVYLFFVRLFKLSQERADADALMLRVNAAVRERDLEGALLACDDYPGPVARVLSAALLRLPYGRSAVEAAFQEASLQEEQQLSRGLRPLATIAQAAPLLGLLGTVTGMIIAFAEISRQGTGDPAGLADGIGQALVTTAAGLIVAIPTLIGQNYLASRVDAILIEIDKRREELMGNVAQVVAARRDDGSERAYGADVRAPARGASGPKMPETRVPETQPPNASADPERSAVTPPSPSDASVRDTGVRNTGAREPNVRDTSVPTFNIPSESPHYEGKLRPQRPDAGPPGAKRS